MNIYLDVLVILSAFSLEPLESASLDDSLILGESPIEDVIKAKGFIDKILNLIKQLRLTITRKYTKDVQVNSTSSTHVM